MRVKRVVQMVAGYAMAVTLTGCFLLSSKKEIKATNLMAAVEPTKTVTGTVNDQAFVGTVADFSVNLFKEANSETENTMVSPLSVYTALCMEANGANGETLKQMSDVLYNGQEMDTVNENMAKLMNSLTNTEDAKLNLANSIWFRDEKGLLQMNNEFLQTNANYYDAAIYSGAFDKKMIDDINNWCSNETDKMIPKIIDKVDPDTMMYVINAICFDGKWEEKYKKSQIHDGTFYAENGEEQDVSFMSSDESLYLVDDQATGFIKPYKEGYQFVALLPNEGVSLSDYISSMTGESFLNLVKNAEECSIEAKLPEFENECTLKLNDSLINMGITDAFDDGKADFRNIATGIDGPIYINEVLQKTYIDVDPNGTKAAAITSISTNCDLAYVEEKSVILDHPFVYAIVDQNTSLPVFIGTVRNLI